MKLFYFPPSPNTRKVLAVVHQLGLELDLELVSLVEGQQLKPDYLALNPNHMTPTLQDQDFVLWESNAIMQYLAAQKPGNTLWPANAKSQADISRWQCWQLAHWSRACQSIIWERVVKPLLGQGQPDERIVAEADEEVRRFAGVLNQHLSGRQWLVDQQVTLADFAVGADLTYREQARLPVEDYSELKRWYAGLEGLEAWQKSAPPPMS